MFDSHAHIINDFYNSIEKLIKECKENNIIGIINCADSLETSFEVISLSKKYKNFLYATAGIHPDNINIKNLEDIKEIEKIIKNNDIVAIGEIGLDYYHNKENKDLQKKIFIEQIKLANKYNLPVLIHNRDATDDCLKILKKYKPKGIVHCFSGSLETAKEYLKLGLYLGIGGVITFKNSNLPLVLKEIKLENIVLETDSPFLTPVPHRGKENSPKYLYYIAKKIAEIKKITVEEVYKQTLRNTKNIFKL